MLNFFTKAEKIICLMAKAFCLISISSMVILVFLNVILRYIFNSGIPIGDEIARYFFIWSVFVGVVLAYRDKEHVGVTLVVDALKGTAKKIMLVLGNLVSTVTIGYLLISSIAYLKVAHRYNSPASGIPFSFVAIILVIASISILLLNNFDLYRLLKTREGDS